MRKDKVGAHIDVDWIIAGLTLKFSQRRALLYNLVVFYFFIAILIVESLKAQWWLTALLTYFSNELLGSKIAGL